MCILARGTIPALPLFHSPLSPSRCATANPVPLTITSGSDLRDVHFWGADRLPPLFQKDFHRGSWCQFWPAGRNSLSYKGARSIFSLLKLGMDLQPNWAWHSQDQPTFGCWLFVSAWRFGPSLNSSHWNEFYRNYQFQCYLCSNVCTITNLRHFQCSVFCSSCAPEGFLPSPGMLETPR